MVPSTQVGPLKWKALSTETEGQRRVKAIVCSMTALLGAKPSWPNLLTAWLLLQWYWRLFPHIAITQNENKSKSMELGSSVFLCLIVLTKINKYLLRPLAGQGLTWVFSLLLMTKLQWAFCQRSWCPGSETVSLGAQGGTVWPQSGKLSLP